MSIQSRLLQYINHRGIPVHRFEVSIGVSTSYVARMRQSISPKVLERIGSKYPDLSIEWLMIGRGEMIKSTTMETIIDQLLMNNSKQAETISFLMEEIRQLKEKQGNI